MNAYAHPSPHPETVLAKAVLRASEQLGLKQAELAAVIGIHRTAVSRLKKNRALDPHSKEGELALLLIRLARALFALTGGDKEWMLLVNPLFSIFDHARQIIR
ncbi:MAG TPA: helix-turn-helix domain-containing protein [Methylothermaceae bacterium]|nr:helix-turn-helix domain-containing protein [Methylothermaceae bacterium]